MKQAILTFEKCDILLAELPEAKEIRIEKGIINNLLVLEEVFRIYDGGKYLCRVPYPAQLIGKLSELTKEQFTEIVGGPLYDNGGVKDDNGIDKLWEPFLEDEFPYESAKETFLGKLRAEGYYTENPAGSYEEACVSLDANCRTYEESQWEIGQLLTYAPEQTYVFKIIKQ